MPGKYRDSVQDNESSKFVELTSGQVAVATKSSLSTSDGLPVDESNPLPVFNLGGLVPEKYDSISITYVASGNGVGEIETVTYIKSSEIIAILTLSYNIDNALSGVVRS